MTYETELSIPAIPRSADLLSRLTYSPRYVSQLTKNTLALILAGGRGSRLQHLTQWRAKPAVPFGGQFRIIDFPLSNCVNSGIRRIGVLTQYKAHSLIRHVQRGWQLLNGEFDEFVELLPAQQRLEGGWYQGTADAVYQNLDILRSHKPQYVLILAGDHVYKMDYGPMLAYHVEHQADLTVGSVKVPRQKASAFGVLAVDGHQRVIQFTEKPANPPAMPGSPDSTLTSMGIYIFNTDFLIDQLIRDADNKQSSHDFGKDLMPDLVHRHRVYAYPFRDTQQNTQAYWRDVGTVDAYWKTNLELIGDAPELDLYDREWPIRTFMTQAPPAKFSSPADDSTHRILNAMISSGCVVEAATIIDSILFSDVKVSSGSTIHRSVLLPEVIVGRNCQIRDAVIDKGTVLPDGMIIGADQKDDRSRFYVSPGGVVLITPDMLGQRIHHAR